MISRHIQERLQWWPLLLAGALTTGCTDSTGPESGEAVVWADLDASAIASFEPERVDVAFKLESSLDDERVGFHIVNRALTGIEQIHQQVNRYQLDGPDMLLIEGRICGHDWRGREMVGVIDRSVALRPGMTLTVNLNEWEAVREPARLDDRCSISIGG